VSASEISAPGEIGEGVAPAPGAPPPVAPLAEPPVAPATAPVTVAAELPPAPLEVAAVPVAEVQLVEATPAVAPAPPGPASTAAEAPMPLDPAVAALCAPLSEADPCGPDLDLAGDAAYLNFFASAEGVLPSSFFSAEDGKPFDRTTVDLAGQIAAVEPLLQRTRDIRLLMMRARLLILNRDLAGFAVSVAAVAEWLDKHWDAVHPRPQDGDASARAAAVVALDLPTVVFPLQYAPLFDARRVGKVTYRAWMIATDETKARAGEQKHAGSALTEAIATADPRELAASRKHLAMIKAALGRIRAAFALQGASDGMQTLPAQVDKIRAFVDPLGSAGPAVAAPGAADAAAAQHDAAAAAPGGAPASLAQAKEALAAIADYYSRHEPSSPTLPLVRQAHHLIGKSFIEVIGILVPAHMEKAAFQIGAEQVFELPLGRMSKLPEAAGGGGAGNGSGAGAAVRYNVQSRAQAIALLELVQRFFRSAEPSSPVPMLCERARALAERDFMGVLRDVLPKGAFKIPGADK
jgi:type VI secretion system protein ImpA